MLHVSGSSSNPTGHLGFWYNGQPTKEGCARLGAHRALGQEGRSFSTGPHTALAISSC